MTQNRDFAWLRSTLCDEIEAVRTGASDHNRAKSIAGLAAAALKSVEVEAMLRQQQTDLGAKAPALGSLPLCAPSTVLVSDNTAPEEAAPEQSLTVERAPDPDITGIKAPIEITEVDGFKVGDRVFCPNGKHGTVAKVTAAGRIEVREDEGGTLPYSKRNLAHATTPPQKITSPVVPAGPVPRFVAGKHASGSR